MLQFVDRKHNQAPSYLEKLTLYFHPEGGVIVLMGNQAFRATPDDVEKLVKSRLERHAQYYELFGQAQ